MCPQRGLEKVERSINDTPTPPSLGDRRPAVEGELSVMMERIAGRFSLIGTHVAEEGENHIIQCDSVPLSPAQVGMSVHENDRFAVWSVGPKDIALDVVLGIGRDLEKGYYLLSFLYPGTLSTSHDGAGSYYWDHVDDRRVLHNLNFMAYRGYGNEHKWFEKKIKSIPVISKNSSIQWRHEVKPSGSFVVVLFVGCVMKIDNRHSQEQVVFLEK